MRGAGGDIPGKQRDVCSDPRSTGRRFMVGLGRQKVASCIYLLQYIHLELSVRGDLGVGPRGCCYEKHQKGPYFAFSVDS